MRSLIDINLYKFSHKDALALAIGNFDGLHRGHQLLIKKVIAMAEARNLKSAALSFMPSPEEFFRADQKKAVRLFTDAQKLQAFAEMGCDVGIIARFDQELSMTPRDKFYDDILVNALNAQVLVTGYDFRFGQDRAGNIDYLRDKSAEGIEVHSESSLNFDDKPISSTRIRQAVSRGSVDHVSEMLGRPYAVSGWVKKGRQLGRKIGFPTANLFFWQQLLPRGGVYAGYISVKGINTNQSILTIPSDAFPAVINIGFRPTIDQESGLSLEAHVIDQTFAFDKFYDREATFYFVGRLRDEQKFSDLVELASAIRSDVDAARHFLKCND